VECQLRLAGHDEAVVAGALELHRRFDEWAHRPPAQCGRKLAVDLKTYADEPWWSLVWFGDRLLGERGRRLWIEEMDFDPIPVFERVRAPTLLFYGEADPWTPVTPSIDAWRAARGDQVQIVVVPDARHDMSNPSPLLADPNEDDSRRGAHAATDALALVVDLVKRRWTTQTTRGRPYAYQCGLATRREAAGPPRCGGPLKRW
jgi:pimeloyl-ACP methyl ester carboxylesterase